MDGENGNDDSVCGDGVKTDSTNEHDMRAKRACTLKAKIRIPLSPIKNRFNYAPNNKNSDEIINQKCSHDDIIRRLLRKQFKVPIAGYVGEFVVVTSNQVNNFQSPQERIDLLVFAVLDQRAHFMIQKRRMLLFSILPLLLKLNRRILFTIN